MKGLKLKTGISLILFALVMSPKGICASPINATIYLNMLQISPTYNMPVSQGDVALWSFQTYNSSFNVQAIATGVGVMVSSGKTSDSGSVEAQATGNILFTFMNLGSSGGYIDIAIHIKEDAIGGYQYIFFIIIPVSILVIVLTKKKILE